MPFAIEAVPSQKKLELCKRPCPLPHSSPIDDGLILRKPEHSGFGIAILSQRSYTSNLCILTLIDPQSKAVCLNKPEADARKACHGFGPFVKTSGNSNRVGEGQIPQFHLHWRMIDAWNKRSFIFHLQGWIIWLPAHRVNSLA